MSTIEEAVVHVLATRELAEKVAAAREEQREIDLAAITRLATCYPTDSDVRKALHFVADEIRALALTRCPLRATIMERDAVIKDLRADAEQTAAVTKRLSDELAESEARRANLSEALTKTNGIYAKHEAELEAVRDQAAEAFDTAGQAYEEIKAHVPGPDQVVILKADYERLIASLPAVRSVK